MVVTGVSLNRLQSPPRQVFSVSEGQALKVLDALLGTGRGADVREPVRLDPLRPELLHAGAQRISRTAFRYLCERGGWRDRVVLRANTRTSGRLWDANLNTDFRLNFTQCTRKLWIDGARVLPPLSSLSNTADSAQVSAPGHKRHLRDLVSLDPCDTGDWLVMHLTLQNLASWRLASNDFSVFSKRLRLASPLAALFDPSPETQAEILTENFRRLVNPSAIRLIECLEDHLALTWTANALATASSRADPAVLQTRWRSLGATVSAWVTALDTAQRLDLVRPIVALLRALADGPFSEGGESVRRALTALPQGFRSLDARDALLDAVRSALNAFTLVLRLRDALASERYGDSRYTEAQALLRAVDNLGAQRRRLLDGVASALGNSLG